MVGLVCYNETYIGLGVEETMNGSCISTTLGYIFSEIKLMCIERPFCRLVGALFLLQRPETLAESLTPFLHILRSIFA